MAIPHTDPEHVNDAAICLGILDKPVTFNVMGMEGETTDVSLLFMLSIKHKEDQMGYAPEINNRMSESRYIERDYGTGHGQN